MLLLACAVLPCPAPPGELTQPVGLLWFCTLGCQGCESTPYQPVLGFLKAFELVGQLVWPCLESRASAREAGGEKHVWAAEMSYRPWLPPWQCGPAGSVKRHRSNLFLSSVEIEETRVILNITGFMTHACFKPFNSFFPNSPLLSRVSVVLRRAALASAGSLSEMGLPGPAPDLLNLSLYLITISRWFVCSLKSEKPA